MPCDPLNADDVILPPVPDGSLLPQLPQFDLPLPPLPIEDLLDLFETLRIILPGGIMRPHLSSQFSKNTLDAILSLLEKFMPVLMAYNFLMPILEMILCIIEILCSLTNTFKLIKALIRLFRVCLPDFLSLFPIFALILMILSLLLLILALIIYLIQRIIAFIKQLVKNIIFLANAIAAANTDSVIAITIKLGDLLCIFQNLFVLLGVIILIFEVIERLLRLFFKLPPCDSDDTSDDGCCTPEVCPSFLKNNKEIVSNVGTLQYFNNVIRTSTSGNTTLRSAGFQLYDASAPQNLAFNNITHAFDLPAGVSQVFFPQDGIYTAGTTPNSAPYTADVRIFYDPALYGRTDKKGARFIRIKDCIVLAAPVDGVSDYQNNLIAPFNGTISIAGGTAYEDDGITIMKVSSSDTAAGTLNTVISLPDNIGPAPTLSPTDGIRFDNITYTFKINHVILIAKSLLTISCHPDLAFNRNFINNTIGAQLNSSGEALGRITLPDVQGTQDCIINAINEFRQGVSVDAAEKLQTTVIGCLTDLQNQTNDVLGQVIDAGFNPFKSDFTLDPTIQFTTQSIKVSVILNEAGGNNIANNLPADVAAKLAAKLEAVISFGEITTFTYDGSSKFVAYITSKESGNGTIKVSYNGEFISILDNPADTTQTPSVTVKELLYTFVQTVAIEGAVRRDEGDVVRDNG